MAISEMRATVKTGMMLCVCVCAALVVGGCVGHKIYNSEPEQYLQEVEVSGLEGQSFDLAIIEFADHGLFWKLDQLEDTIDLIERRNAESERGVLVVIYVHGWQQNADPNAPRGSLAIFKEGLADNVAASFVTGEGAADRVIGVFLGWRGKTSQIPIQRQATFWDRRMAAERVVSLNMREALFRIMETTNRRPDSKSLLTGHSMGGLIIGKALTTSLTTLLLSSGQDGTPMPADLVLLMQPAIEALEIAQFIDFLKRSETQLVLRKPSGELVESAGPLIVSITSEADRATGRPGRRIRSGARSRPCSPRSGTITPRANPASGRSPQEPGVMWTTSSATEPGS